MASNVALVEPDEPEEVAAPLTLGQIMAMSNVAVALPDSDLARIGSLVVEEHDIDLDSMSDWLKRMEEGLKLASLAKEAKDYPWPKAANVKYPLVTTAALQFNAKAYPAVVPSGQVVQAKVWGADTQGKKAARGDRVCQHMSYQLLCKIEEWEESTDKLLTLLPIVGTVVRKVWYDRAQGRIRCRMITPGDFVVHDKVKTLSDAPRCSERLSLYPSEIMERCLTGEWLDQDYREEDGQDTQASECFIEQHRRLDLDGDGYEEPYIVTVHEKTRKVARIVADFSEQDISTDGERVLAIKRGSYFIPYHFLPSLTGGFLSTGFGLLLGDISETINSIINMMLDAGHAASLGGGFIGAEWRIKGGAQRMRPGEWRMVQANGATVRDAIVPMTTPGPDATLFQLLGLLIEAGKEVASIKDVLMGETGGKQMTATTTLALIEQGMAQFTAAYKRIFRSLKHEFKLIAGINARTVSPEEYNRFHDLAAPAVGPDGQPMMGPDGKPLMQPVMLDPAQEYDLSDYDITPVADPQSVTRMQEAAKAQMLMEMAQAGLVDPKEASRRMLEATSVGNVEELLPKPDPMQQAAMQAQMADLKVRMMESQAKAHDAAMKAQTAQAQAQTAQAELATRSQEIALAARETQAQVALMAAQVDKIYAEIGQKDRQISIDAATKAAQVAGQEKDRALAAHRQVADIQGQQETRQLAREQAETAARQKGREIGQRD